MFDNEPACCSENAQKWAFSHFNCIRSNGAICFVSIKLTMLARVDAHNAVSTVVIIFIIVCINDVSKVRKMRIWHVKT